MQRRCNVWTGTLVLVIAVGIITPSLCGSSRPYYLLPRTDIPGQDINCGQKEYNGNALTYCRLSNGLSALLTACDSNSRCKAVTMSSYGYTGYLKTAAAPTSYNEDFVAIVAGKTPKGKYAITLRQSLPGQEIDCGKKDYKGNRIPFCEICGGFTALVAACDANPKCVAFDMSDNGSCGYLKTGTKGAYMEGTNSFIRAK